MPSNFPEASCDVLIVGYGPVGAAIAALLGRHGVRTIVIERSHGVYTEPRAIALDNEALRILQTVGLGEEAFAKVVIPYVRMLCPYVGEFNRLDTSGSIDCHPKLVTFYQPELERALRALVACSPSVEVHERVEFVQLEEDGNSVRVTVNDLRSQRRTTICSRYVVGADGAGSRVRAAIGQDATGTSYAEDWLIVDVLGAPGAFDHVEFVCNPRRPTPHMVAPGGRTRWEFMLRPGESSAVMESEAKVRELIAPWVGSADVRIERKAVYRFAARCCERFRVGRVFLAGDAAHVTPPFAGQGLVAGLRDAVNLAWKLAWVVQERAAPSILDSYDEERRPHANKMIELAKWMGKLIMPLTPLRALLLHGAMRALRLLPRFRALTEQLEIKPANAYAKGLFLPGPSAVRRGAWFPQGLVRRSWGKVELSDDVLGSKLSLVGLGVDPAAALSDETARAWSRTGGNIVEIAARGCAGSRATSAESLDDRLVPGAGPRGWCAVVRPDRTVLHDGPAADADRIAREALQLLGALEVSAVDRGDCIQLDQDVARVRAPLGTRYRAQMTS